MTRRRSQFNQPLLKAGTLLVWGSSRGLCFRICDRRIQGQVLIHHLLQGKPLLDPCPPGRTQLLGFFVGAVMKETGGKANPKTVNEILRRLLGE